MTGSNTENRILPVPRPGKTGWPWTTGSEPLPDKMPDDSPWPKISLVTPSFNQGQFIEETIRSVLLQGYPKLEYIIIDGGSTDNTLDIIKKYEPWLTYWVSEPDRGQSHAINKGIEKATGEILLWLNSDDLVLPGVFALIAQKFHEHPCVSLVSGQAKQIDKDGNVIGDLQSYYTNWEELLTNPRNSIRQISTFFSRELFNDHGLLNEDLFISMDKELLVRFTRCAPPLVIDDYVSAFRVHENSKTASQLIRGYYETDQLRLKQIKRGRLRRLYRKRSSNNWLSLAESENYSSSERSKCLKSALKIKPTIILSRNCWSVIRKILTLKNTQNATS